MNTFFGIARRIGRGLYACRFLTVLPASLFLMSNAAVAQQSSSAAADETIEEIQVTGTRMRGTQGPVGAEIITLGREDIDLTNKVTVTDMLREVPQILNLGVTESTRDTPGGNGNITYGNGINIRGLGPFSTLVLINGHRVVTNSRNVEPTALPLIAIDRIEVVPDGASAVYGSDAVAGVVNMVMRRNLDGAAVEARYGTADGYDEYRIGAYWGTTWDSGQFFVAGELNDRTALSGDDRDFYGLGQQSNQCDPGTIIIGGESYAIPAGGITQADAGTLVPGTENLCNPNAGNDLLPDQQHTNVVMTFNQDIGENLEFFADGFYSLREFERYTGWTNALLTVPSTNAFFVDPTGAATTSQVGYEFRDYPNDNTPGEAGYSQLTGGLRWDLAGSWQLEGLVSYGEATEVSNATDGTDNGDLSAALASSDPATAFDPYGLGRTSQAVLDGIRDFQFVVDHTMKFTLAQLSADGELFELPGGAVKLAVGYEYQDYDYGPTLVRGPPGTPPGCRPCQVAGTDTLLRDVNSVYAEFLFPIIGDGNARSGFQRLDVRAAVRYDDYSDIGDTTNPQFGVTWGITDGFDLRASYGTSFRAPLIPDLYGNSSAFFPEPFPDPLLGGADRPGLFQSGGNLNLSPEEATTWTIGMDWTPESLPGLLVKLTWFDVDYEGQIQQYLGDNNILFREDQFDGTGIIVRDQAAADLVADLMAQGIPVFGVLPDPVTLYVDGRPQNLGVTQMSGLDFQVGYDWENDYGSWNATVGGMYVADYKEAITPSADLVDLKNQIFKPLTLRGTGRFSWMNGPYSANLRMYYTGSYDNVFVDPVDGVDSNLTFDLGASMRIGDADGGSFSDGWMLGLDIRNLFDEEPPYVNVFPFGYDPTAADPMGRLWSVSLRKTF